MDVQIRGIIWGGETEHCAQDLTDGVLRNLYLARKKISTK